METLKSFKSVGVAILVLAGIGLVAPSTTRGDHFCYGWRGHARPYAYRGYAYRPHTYHYSYGSYYAPRAGYGSYYGYRGYYAPYYRSGAYFGPSYGGYARPYYYGSAVGAYRPYYGGTYIGAPYWGGYGYYGRTTTFYGGPSIRVY